MEKLQYLFSLLQANPWPSAAGIVILIWTVYENWDKIREKFPTLNPAKETVSFVNEKDWPPFVPVELNIPPAAINERSLSTNERQQVFYYLERIRAYAEATKNTEANKNCVDLLNNLFKDYKHPSQSPTNIIDSIKGNK